MTDTSGSGSPATAGSSLRATVPEAAAGQTDPAVVSMALQLGWVVMVLFGPFDPYDPSGTGITDRVPTEHELSKPTRIAVELTRLDCLVKQLNGTPLSLPTPDGAGLSASSAPLLVDDGPRRTALLAYNESLLEGFACADRQVGLAYQLGRSLRVTANPPVGVDQGHTVFLAAVARNLRRERTVRIQGWLSVLAAELPNESGPIVSASLGRWSEWASTVLDDAGRAKVRQPASEHVYAAEVRTALLEQGDDWLNVLTGARSTAGLLTPESYVAAGEAALSRTTRIVRQIVLHNWVALAIVAVALAAVLYASFRYLGGAAKVWTEIVAIAGALGITAKGISATVVRLSAAAERPIYHAAELDALAWAVTTLPSEDSLSPNVIRALRRGGIQGPSPLARA
jgi:hypothetical protein